MKACDCTTACVLTRAERYHLQVRCRYRNGTVRPAVKTQEQIVSDMEMDRQAARDGYNPNR